MLANRVTEGRSTCEWPDAQTTGKRSALCDLPQHTWLFGSSDGLYLFSAARWQASKSQERKRPPRPLDKGILAFGLWLSSWASAVVKCRRSQRAS